MPTLCKVHIMWSCVCRIVEGAMDLFLKMRHKGETTEIEHLLCVYLKLLFSEVFSHKPKLKKKSIPIKVRSQTTFTRGGG